MRAQALALLALVSAPARAADTEAFDALAADGGCSGDGDGPSSQCHVALAQLRAHSLSSGRGRTATPSDSMMTPLNDDGGGNSKYFDRHDLSCPQGSLMTRWHLSRSGSKMQFHYSCDAVEGGLGDCASRQTSLNDAGGGNTAYFDRHNVGCGEGQALTQWKLNRAGTDNRMQFDYTCCGVLAGLGAPSQTTTSLNDMGGGNALYFDRHDLACPAGQAMTQWRFTRAGTGSKMQFEVSCAAVMEPTAAPTPAPTPAPPAPQPQADASVYGDPHVVDFDSSA